MSIITDTCLTRELSLRDQQIADLKTKSEQTVVVAAGNVTAGALPSNVTVGASQITGLCTAVTACSSALPSGGVASEGTTKLLGSDGKLYTIPVSVPTTSLSASSITAGVLSSGVAVPASQVTGLCTQVQVCLNTATVPASNLTGIVPAANLPSYVDDVLEFSSASGFPVVGEAGKIYTSTATNNVYRWTGSTYVEMSAGSGNSMTVPASGVQAGVLPVGVSIPASQVTGLCTAVAACGEGGTISSPTVIAGSIASGSYAIRLNDGTGRIEQYMRVYLGTDTNNTTLSYLVPFGVASSINVTAQSYASVGASGGSRFGNGAHSNNITTYTVVNDGAAADFFVFATGL